MTHLVPCPGCQRHVRVSEPHCPFCAVALSLANTPAPVLPTTRLGRAATFAFGATLLGASAIVGCSGESEERREGGTGGSSGSANGGSANGGSANGGSSTGGTQSTGGYGGGLQPPYGIPPYDAGTDSGAIPIYGAAPPPDGGFEDDGGGAQPEYGAPPMDGGSGQADYGAAPAD